MTVNLEDFVDKEVVVTFRDGDKVETIIGRNYDSIYSYWVLDSGSKRTYTKDGVYDIEYDNPYNIKSIQLKNSPKELNVTKLSNSTFQKLADTLTSEVIEYIEQDSRYVDFMYEVIPDALSHMMGQLDDDLKCELSTAIMDRIVMNPSKIVRN